MYKNGAVDLVFSNSKELLSPVILSLSLGPTTLKLQLMPGAAKTWTPMRVFCIDGASDYNRLCGYFGTPATNSSISCQIYSASIPSDLNYKYTVNCSGKLNIKGETVTSEQSYYKLVIQPIGSGSELAKKIGYTLRVVTIKRDTDITVIDYNGDKFAPYLLPDKQIIKEIIAKSKSTGKTYTINPFRAFYSYNGDPTNVYFGGDYYAGGCLYYGLPIYRLDYDYIYAPRNGYEIWDCIQNYPAGAPLIDLPSDITDLSFISWDWGEPEGYSLYPIRTAKRVIEFHR